METLDSTARPLVAKSEDGEEWVASQLFSTEGLDKLFEHRVVILSRQLNETDLLGKGITLCYHPMEASSRIKQKYFHGFCIQVRQIGRMESRQYVQYELTLTAWPWFMSKRTNCRVFQQKKTGEIIKTLSREHGFNTELVLNASGDVRSEYVVQFNESDWAFISRLLASRGWFYFFDQQDGHHQLIIGDNNRIFRDSGETEVEYFAGQQQTAKSHHSLGASVFC